MKFAYGGAWTDNRENDIDELTATLYTKFEMLTLTPPTDDRESEEPPLNETAARAAYRAAGKACWHTMNAASLPPQERMKQRRTGSRTRSMPT